MVVDPRGSLPSQMVLGKLQPATGGLYFCTFVCWAHIPLIDRTHLYDAVYEKLNRWVDKGCSISGYVIMPNHVHLLMYAPAGTSINEVLGNSKRWWAKLIIDRLTEAKEGALLRRLQRDVDHWRFNKKGQWYRVWETSSDIKLCFSPAMTEQKLKYIHNNPLQPKWCLVDAPEDFPHSSAAYYNSMVPGPMPLVHWKEFFPE